MGVLSTIEVMLIPLLAMPLIAASLPEPIPLTAMDASVRPIALPFSKASFATKVAAYGVDFLEPLKPRLPAEDQITTSPIEFVILTMVLLYVECILMIPLASCFFLDFFDAKLADFLSLSEFEFSAFVIIRFCPKIV